MMIVMVHFLFPFSFSLSSLSLTLFAHSHLIGTSYCVYCPENGALPCEPVNIYTNEGDCGNAFACELPDGTVDFTLSEEECRFISNFFNNKSTTAEHLFLMSFH